METTTEAEYWVLAGKIYRETPNDVRWGQNLFNVLFTVRPDLAQHVNGSIHDPFYADGSRGGRSRISAYVLWLNANW